jgi:TIR domain
MKLFICWSSERGHKLAEALHRWLPEVIEGLDEPFLSSEIEAGTRWSEKVTAALQASDAGLVCLTPEGVDSAWVHFEAGALTMAVKGVLYMYSHNVPASRVPEPMRAFQLSKTTRDSTLDMVKSIARRARADGTVDEVELTTRFDRAWLRLAEVISELNTITIEAAIPGFHDLFVSKTFNEPMPECHDRSWTGRLERLARVDALLQHARGRVVTLEEPHLLWLYERLLDRIGVYTMNIRSVVLLTNNSQPIRPADIPIELMKGCEVPRIEILHLKQQLLDPNGAPVLRDSVRFQGMDTLQRKITAQMYERRIASGETLLPVAERRRALDSSWDLDRMVSYQSFEAEARGVEQIRDLARHVRSELARAETRTTPVSLMPLYCAVRALETSVRRLPSSPELIAAGRAVLEVAGEVRRYVSADPDRDANGKFARRLEGIQSHLSAAPAA